MILSKIKKFINLGKGDISYFLEKLSSLQPIFDTIQIEHNLNYFEANKINSQFSLYHSTKDQILLGYSSTGILTNVQSGDVIIPSILLPLSAKVFHNFFLHQSYQQIVQKFIKELKQIQFPRVEDTSQESRGLEWCRVSFSMLKKALAQTTMDESTLVQAKVFYGKSLKK
jgi:hypothetical protein